MPAPILDVLEDDDDGGVVAVLVVLVALFEVVPLGDNCGRC